MSDFFDNNFNPEDWDWCGVPAYGPDITSEYAIRLAPISLSKAKTIMSANLPFDFSDAFYLYDHWIKDSMPFDEDLWWYDFVNPYDITSYWFIVEEEDGSIDVLPLDAVPEGSNILAWGDTFNITDYLAYHLCTWNEIDLSKVYCPSGMLIANSERIQNLMSKYAGKFEY